MKLSYEEINSPVMSKELVALLTLRNGHTIRAAHSKDIFEYVHNGLDESDMKRLARIQLTMVGPGDISREWKAPQPMAPIPYDAVGELLLKINQNEVNFHSGVIPVGVRPHEFWSGMIVAQKQYQPTDSGKDILNQASEDGSLVKPDGNGITVYARDRDRVKQRSFVLVGKLGKFLPDPISDDETKIDISVALGNVPYMEPADFKISKIENPRHYLDDGAGKVWYTEFVKKIFLRSASDLANKKKKAGGGITNRKLPDQVFQGILRLKIDKELKSELGKFLMQFASVVLMQRAFDLFEAELQKMELDGSWISPGINLFEDEQDEQAAFFQ